MDRHADRIELLLPGFLNPWHRLLNEVPDSGDFVEPLVETGSMPLFEHYYIRGALEVLQVRGIQQNGQL
jgi:hypothetical protein